MDYSTKEMSFYALYIIYINIHIYLFLQRLKAEITFIFIRMLATVIRKAQE
jgi:hypothetical protein